CQEGHGRGADVAASAHGGIVEFRRDGGRLAVAPRTLPAGLELFVGWTGEPAPTDPLVKHFASSAGRREPGALGELTTVAETAARAIRVGDAVAFCAAVTASAELLERLGREVGIPIVTPPLPRLLPAGPPAGAPPATPSAAA